MKKIFALLMAVLMVFAVSACKNEGTAPTVDDTAEAPVSETEKQPEAPPAAPAPAAETEKAPTPESSQDTSTEAAASAPATE